MSEEFDPDNRGQVILYRANGVNVPVEVTYWRRTFWMPQKNIARLFGVNVPAVSKHLANIYAEGELAESATMSEMEIVRNEGGRTVRRTIRFYSLDAIIAVGYRVSSPQATAFRQWATSVLHEYMIKGFALKSDVTVAKNYLDENELTRLNRLTSGFLDMIENRVAARLTTTMPEFIQLVSQYIQLSGGATLTGKGTVTRKQADRKAAEEYAKFNAAQPYDFEEFAKGIDGGRHDGIGR